VTAEASTRIPGSKSITNRVFLLAAAAPGSTRLQTPLDPITNTGAFVSWKAARIHDDRNAEDPLVATARRNAPAHLVTS
jgi:5-enolpyruvylshikimate-3-phosphate synthase